MHLTEEPLSSINSAILIAHFSETAFLVLEVGSNVDRAISKPRLSLAVHLAILPFTNVDSSITPLVGSKAMDFILFKLACVCGAIFPVECAFAMFLAVQVVSDVFHSIGPTFLSMARLHILFPVSHKNRTSKVCV